MSWLSRANFTAADVLSYASLNNLANDIRAWGGNVNGGGYTLSNFALGAPVLISSDSTNLLGIITNDGVAGMGQIQLRTHQVGSMGSAVMLMASRGSVASPANVGLGDCLGGLFFAGNTSGAYRYTASVEALVDDAGTISAASLPSHLRFYTTPTGSVSRLERLRIDSAGRVGIGATNLSAGLAVRHISNTSTQLAQLRLEDSASSMALSVGTGVDAGASQVSWMQSTESGVSNNRALSLQPFSGKVGIGTTIPASILDVRGPRWVPASGWQGVAALYSTDALGADVGAGLLFGGVYDAATVTEFGQIAGVKENATIGNAAGALVLSSRPNGGAITERLRIDSTGRVGIGASSPSAKLHVVPGPGFSLAVPPAAGSAAGASALFGGDSPTYGLVVGTLNTGDGYIQQQRTDATSVMYNLLLQPNGGRVGIGGANPWGALQVNGVQDTANQLPQLRLTNSPTTGMALNISVGADAGANKFAWLQSTEPGVSNDRALSLQPFNGPVLIGYTVTNGAYKLQVNGQIFATSATIATSDGRYKTNVKPLEGVLALVNALRPVSFDWLKHPVHNFDLSHPSVGFIAQEVKEALGQTWFGDSIVKPHVCRYLDARGHEQTEEFLGIAEANLIPLLTRAIQELSMRLAKLESRN